MAHCTKCGEALREGVNFCEKRGAEVRRCMDGVEDDILDDYDGPAVEDCDEEPEKGPPSDCYAPLRGGRYPSIVKAGQFILESISTTM